ncbi:5-dehydro-4-deoxy-D-glucuronate isomerase [Geosporobacter ferrireducens]|uniref:4-deoxy-L-threo-5-hexosulose-uronate ketol-isomerase n=1 Tax=Geosporobacter ferrireducens TaxID=1424294 RepID=A0A1D8GML1_9FIRM|nr:5-dehydro-4-deoxy-D-glucuronate isomerase [Geosporobacter ferrireducens]AOT72127.1 5-dehydro-4-deoxy-D-glucuronate isomerase [Geosporobacter ferrireducens]MTI56015.1 5-dehydro-4-deoxy-D-glucuronate isomerase [Geosporobacter ferrireducens]
MEERNMTHPKDAQQYNTDRIREEYLVENLFVIDEIKTVYSYGDRMIIGGAYPKTSLNLTLIEVLKSEIFLERREMGVINIGGPGIIIADGIEYTMDNKDGLYIGMGTKEITFVSVDAENLSKFYFISTTAHCAYETSKINHSDVDAMELGTQESSNQRILYKYIHPDSIKSCQLLMGMTTLKPGSVWNSIPPHAHSNRSEVYLYFDLPEQEVVFHFMGKPTQTRHILVKNEQAVISPYWSIHSGVGTKNYSFLWAMAGENQLFSDANSIELKDLK